jgi:YVTN family beta-propeller protein
VSEWEPSDPDARAFLRERRAARARARLIRRRRRRAGLALVLLGLLLIGIVIAVASGGGGKAGSAASRSSLPAASSPLGPPARGNIYAADFPGNFTPAARQALPRVYVPNSMSNTVDVIDPATFRIVGHFPVGKLPQHVTPSWDGRVLYVDNDDGNSLTPVNPRTARPMGPPIPVEDPYNMYFTADGGSAIVVAERLLRLDFRNPRTFAMQYSLSVPMCPGVDHMDFSVTGRYLFASCEFAGRMIKVDVARRKVVATLELGPTAAPQDVKLSPDGRVLYSADQSAGGLWEIDPDHFKVIGFLHTGAGAHGIYPSRNAKDMYVSNRGEGSISVVSFRTRRVLAKWNLPGGGSPDMGNVSNDGRVLWLSGRYSSEVYAIDTQTGRLLARILVGQGPHGLCVWPQPGRFSLGHTGIMR